MGTSSVLYGPLSSLILKEGADFVKQIINNRLQKTVLIVSLSQELQVPPSVSEAELERLFHDAAGLL